MQLSLAVGKKEQSRTRKKNFNFSSSDEEDSLPFFLNNFSRRQQQIVACSIVSRNGCNLYCAKCWSVSFFQPVTVLSSFYGKYCLRYLLLLQLHRTQISFKSLSRLHPQQRFLFFVHRSQQGWFDTFKDINPVLTSDCTRTRHRCLPCLRVSAE